MSDTNTPVAEVTDDLDAFSEQFFGQGIVTSDEVPLTPEPEVKPDELEDTPDPVEDAPTPEPDASEPEDEAEPEADKPKGKQSAQDRIRELTAARKEAERREESLRAEFEKLKALVEGKTENKAEPAPAPSNDGPTPDDLNEDGSEKYPLGEYDPRYIRDLTKHTIKVEREAADREAEEARKANTAKDEQDALTAEWTEKLVEAQKTYPDLQERVQVLDDTFAGVDPAYGEFLASTVMGMDYGPDVLYYLANNLDEATKIVNSGPTRAVIALGRLEARFEKTEEVTKTKLSAAPTPPPTNRGSAPAVGVSPDTDDLDAFSKLYFAKKR